MSSVNDGDRAKEVKVAVVGSCFVGRTTLTYKFLRKDLKTIIKGQ